MTMAGTASFPIEEGELVRVGRVRLKSLDIMRGLVIAAMILVSTPGTWEHVYTPVTHAAWNDTTPTDLIFPFFLFMVGVAIPLSLRKYANGEHDRKTVYWRIARRAALLFALGIVLNLYPAFDVTNYGWSGVGYTGVLQRIALVYLICVLLFLHFSVRSRSAIGAMILIAYWALFAAFDSEPLPGTNVVHQIDQTVLHMEAGGWVPEGFMSTFPAIVTGLIGVHAGTLLSQERGYGDAVIQLFMRGFVLLVISFVWEWHMPFNKNLWTSSFAVYSAGWAMLLLAALIQFVDILGHMRGVVWAEAFGVNAITFYLGFHLLHPLVYSVPVGTQPSLASLWMTAFSYPLFDPRLASLGFAVLFTFILWLISLWMMRQRIFLKL